MMKVENDVAFVEIINAGYLTQRMGASGAQDYPSSAIYKLAENSQSKKINLIF
ncbi:MAG TPA: hypothetical protein VL087_01305 [Nitrospirota bacterium]|nr:hypothetical protein [Nitrospirota bacterium]